MCKRDERKDRKTNNQKPSLRCTRTSFLLIPSPVHRGARIKLFERFEYPKEAMFYLLPLLLLITACRCEVLQVPDEQVSMASLVCITAEKQKKQEMVIDEIFKWLQENLDTFVKLNNLASHQIKVNIDETNDTTGVETTGIGFQEFFANLTKSYILTREEIKCPFADDNQTDNDLVTHGANLEEILQEQQRKIRELEEKVYRLSTQGVLSEKHMDQDGNFGNPSAIVELNELKEEMEMVKNDCRSRIDKFEARLGIYELKGQNISSLVTESFAELQQNLTELYEAVLTVGNLTESTQGELYSVQQDLAALTNLSQSQYASQLQKWTNVVAIKERADKELDDLRDKIKVLVGKQEHDKESSHNLRLKVEESLHELDRKFNNKSKICENDIKVLVSKLDETKVSLERALSHQVEKHGQRLEKVNSELTVNNLQLKSFKANLSDWMQNMNNQLKKTEFFVTKNSERIQAGFCPTELHGHDHAFCLPLGPANNCHCFIRSTKATWEEADRLCRWHGMYLVSIETEQENRAIFGIISDYSDGFWTSGVRQNTYSDTWIWASTGKEFAYTKWKAGEPNGKGRENCLELWYPFRSWNDKSCSTKHSIICEA